MLEEGHSREKRSVLRFGHFFFLNDHYVSYSYTEFHSGHCEPIFEKSFWVGFFPLKFFSRVKSVTVSNDLLL